jgi:hypothetical protein
MKKLTNVQKILKALKSGPKTQADLVRETKVKNVYQIISDLKKKKLVFMDTGKCVNLTRVPIDGVPVPERPLPFKRQMLSSKLRMTADETTKVSAEQLGPHYLSLNQKSSLHLGVKSKTFRTVSVL